MQLLFGTVANILAESLGDSMQKQTGKFVAGIVYCMEPRNSVLGSCNSFNLNKRLDSFGDEFEFDKIAISKLRSCKKNLSFNDYPQIDALKSRLNSIVIPLISADKMASCILALLDLIRNDPSIDNEHKEAFRECLGLYKNDLLQQEQLDVSDFFTGILLYAAPRENRSDKPSIPHISETYISEVSFDQSSGNFVLLFNELFKIFNNLFLENRINEFVERVDPTDRIEEVWVDRSLNFIQQLSEAIAGDASLSEADKTSFIFKKVKQFVNELHNYIEYIGLHVRPLSRSERTSGTVFVPIYRGEAIERDYLEDKPGIPARAENFADQINEYRNSLIEIYKEIRQHMFF